MRRSGEGSRRAQRIFRGFRWLQALAYAGLTTLGFCQVSPTMAQSQVSERTLEVPGLVAPASISVDRWGVPHVRAENEADLFFAQGFNAARDRLWQLDLWKRRGEGLLSEALGPSFVLRDRAARLLLYRGDMYTEWLSYGSDTKRIVQAFVRGINAYIDLCAEQPEFLPPEFGLLGYSPSRWTPESVVRIRSSGLVRNAASEARRARFVDEFGVEALALRESLLPEHVAGVPEGLNLEVFRENVLETYLQGTRGVDWTAFPWDQLAADKAPPAAMKQVQANEQQYGRVAPLPAWQGSNNWAISPSRTSTGRPILADDPHRAVAVPSLRYLVHLQAPGIDVVGAGEPALPGISIGHNGTVAFGLTVFSIDQEDLYVYETRRQSYRYREGWEEMTRVVERIPVRGAPDVKTELRFTRHGPVLYEDPSSNVAVALRAAWLEPGMAPYLAGLSLMRARNWQEFTDAMNRWGAPSENQAYADIQGNIAWRPAGRWPVRSNWDGLLPVPGDGRFEWAGYRDMDALPEEFNPERGFVATANENNLPDDYDLVAGYEWAAPFRVKRIREVLSTQSQHSLDDSVRLQNDVVSLPARRALKALCSTGALEAASPALCSWTGALDKDRGEPALFEVWFRGHLSPGLLAQAAQSRDFEGLAEAIGTPDPRLVLEWLETPELVFGGGRNEAKSQLVALARTTLQSAHEELTARLGSDPNSWRWGDLHRVRLAHPLKSQFPDAIASLPDVGRGGSGETVGNSAYRSGEDMTFDQLGGATFRMVLDVGDWDRSLAINSPGQSGVPSSSHFSDLLKPWSEGEAFPLVYSRAKVDEATRERFVLLPVSEP